VQQGLKEIIQLAAGGGLFGLHGADFGHAGSEFAVRQNQTPASLSMTHFGHFF
jgi:hypothetical protein